MNKFPLYIVSKGRYESMLTARSLESMGLSYTLVIEDREHDLYEAGLRRFGLKRAAILPLDRRYQAEYDTFDGLGMTKSVGPGAARNFVWEHSICEGYAWHWVMDDNIQDFYRKNRCQRYLVRSSSFFDPMEAFCLRFENIAMAGPSYYTFVLDKNKRPPLVLNTRIYSCNLIRNDVPFRWRGRYNEDTDLSLRMLKAGWCTVQFNALLQHKLRTQTVKGGNQADFYLKEGTRPKSEMLVRMHPDVSRLAYRYQRVHHYVDYRPFKRNLLIPKRGVSVSDGVNDFGMQLVVHDSGIGIHDRRDGSD
jgi:hypothetical protein